MTCFTALKRTASSHPTVMFLAVVVTYSALVATAIYTVLSGVSANLKVAVYAWGPMISAGVSVWLSDESVRDWLGQLRNLRIGVHWYLAGVGIMILGGETENILALVTGGDITAPAAPLRSYVFFVTFTLFFAGALEELMWRGFLQPHLQQRFGALSTSVGIGVLWGLWHVPIILAGIGNFTVFWEYMISIIMVSIVLGWLYNNAKAALPVIMITHASHNMPPIGSATGDVPAVFNILSGDAIFYLLCALLITLYAGSTTLTRDRTLPTIPGRFNERWPLSEKSAE